MIRSLRRANPGSLSADERKIFEAPWLFDYGPLDLPTSPQVEGMGIYQTESQGIVFRHIRDALLHSGRKPTGFVPSCGDGFYGLYALQHGAEKAQISFVGQHRKQIFPWHMQQSQIAAKLLGLTDRCTFDESDVAKLEGRYDFGIVADMIGHFPDPQEILVKLREIIKGPMVLFHPTIYRGPKLPLALEVPSTVRAWGSGFTHDKLMTMAVDAGWTVVNEQRKLMPESYVGEKTLSSFLCV